MRKPTKTERPTRTPIELSTPQRKPTKTERPTRTPISLTTPVHKPTRTERPTRTPIELSTPVRKPTRAARPTRTPIELTTPVRKPTREERPTRTPISLTTPQRKPTKTERPTRTPISLTTPVHKPTRTERPTRTPISLTTPVRKPTKTARPTRTPIPVAPFSAGDVTVTCTLEQKGTPKDFDLVFVMVTVENNSGGAITNVVSNIDVQASAGADVQTVSSPGADNLLANGRSFVFGYRMQLSNGTISVGASASATGPNAESLDTGLTACGVATN